MILEAKVKEVLPVQSGDKKDGGKWSNQLIIVETFGQYPKTVALKLPEKLCNQFKVGMVKKFHYELSSREYNGKYYTDVNVWKFEGVTQEEHNQQQQTVNTPDDRIDTPPDGSTDLPF